MRKAVAKRRGLNAKPGDGPAERDRLQLRHHQRRQLVRERGSDEILIRAHPGHMAVRASESTAMTPVNPDVARPLTVFLARARNRFDVGLASRTVAFSGIDR